MHKILIVDDEVSILIMLKRMLERAGYEVYTAANGYEALKVYEREKPQLIITDIIMPEKEGLELIIDLRKTNPDLKIIAISGGGRIQPYNYLPSASLFGANMTFHKPLDPKEFVAAVNKLLG
jgi:YesN/AraC family two-component response regulator